MANGPNSQAKGHPKDCLSRWTTFSQPTLNLCNMIAAYARRAIRCAVRLSPTIVAIEYREWCIAPGIFVFHLMAFIWLFETAAPFRYYCC